MKNSLLIIILIVSIVFMNICNVQAQGDKGKISKQEKKIKIQEQIVYSDKDDIKNSFSPSIVIGDHDVIFWDEGETENPQSGDTCIKIKYNATGDFGWAGLYWVNPAGNWGEKKGGYDLSFAKKLTFWAKGEKGGEYIAVFRFGGLKGDYPDSDIYGIGPVVLTDQWKQYSVDVSKRNLKYIFTGFGIALTKVHNRKGCIFYLDNIKYE